MRVRGLNAERAFNKNAGFYPVKPPAKQAPDVTTHRIALQVARYLEKAGYLVKDDELDQRMSLPNSVICDGPVKCNGLLRRVYPATHSAF